MLGDQKLAEAEQQLQPPGATKLSGAVTVRAYLYLRVGAAYVKAKQLPDAKRVFALGVERYPQDPALWLGLGRSLLDVGKPDEAIAALDHSLALSPTAAAHYRLGEAWALKGEGARAIAMLERSLGFTPGLPATLRSEVEQRLKSLQAGAVDAFPVIDGPNGGKIQKRVLSEMAAGLQAATPTKCVD